jgi:hypothetical protein
LIDRRWYSSILDARSFRGADCDTEQYLVVATVRERFSVSKLDAQKFNMERLNRRKVMKAMKQNQIKISDRFAALEFFSDWEKIIETIKISAKENLGL